MDQTNCICSSNQAPDCKFLTSDLLHDIRHLPGINLAFFSRMCLFVSYWLLGRQKSHFTALGPGGWERASVHQALTSEWLPFPAGQTELRFPSSQPGGRSTRGSGWGWAQPSVSLSWRPLSKAQRRRQAIRCCCVCCASGSGSPSMQSGKTGSQDPEMPGNGFSLELKVPNSCGLKTH